MTILSEETEKYGTNGKSHAEFIAQCDAGDGEYLRITWDDDPEWRYMWIEVTNDKRWRTRLKVAWKVLRGRHPENAAIILNEIAVRNLTEFLTGQQEPPCPHNDTVLTHDSQVYCNECHKYVPPGE